MCCSHPFSRISNTTFFINTAGYKIKNLTVLTDIFQYSGTYKTIKCFTYDYLVSVTEAVQHTAHNYYHRRSFFNTMWRHICNSIISLIFWSCDRDNQDEVAERHFSCSSCERQSVTDVPDTNSIYQCASKYRISFQVCLLYKYRYSPSYEQCTF
jgi:hypothetical protein